MQDVVQRSRRSSTKRIDTHVPQQPAVRPRRARHKRTAYIDWIDLAVLQVLRSRIDRRANRAGPDRRRQCA